MTFFHLFLNVFGIIAIRTKHLLATFDLLFDQVMAILRAITANRFIPRDKVTIWEAGTTIKNPVLLRFPLNDLALLTLRTNDTNFFNDRLRITTIRETGAGKEFAVTAHLHNHWRATNITIEAR